MERSAPDRCLAIVADVQDGACHVGDDAMLAANVERLRAAGRTSLRVVGRVTDVEARSDLVHWARRFAGAPDAPVPRSLAAPLEGADAVLISGGGNLASAWPDLLWQRVALMRAAAERGLPVVVTGQTIGPELSVAERVALRVAFRHVRWVGVREEPSRILAARLGISAERLRLHVDDAFLLGAEAPGDRSRLDDPFVAVTIDPSFGSASRRAALDDLAAQLAEIAASTGLRPVLVPHVGVLGSDRHGDCEIGAVLCARLRAAGEDAVLLPVLAARETVWITQHAAAVVSTRYHPLVFATAGAVPCIGIADGRYSEVKLRGALAHVGAAEWCLALDSSRGDGLVDAFARLWSRRDEVRERARSARAAIEEREYARWREVLAALAPGDEESAVERNRLSAELCGVAAGRARLTESGWREYARDGFIQLGRLVDDDELERLRRRADDLANGLFRNPDILVQRDTGGPYDELPEADAAPVGDGLLYRKVQGLETDELFERLVAHPAILEICGHVYGPHVPVSLFRAMIMNKPARQGTDLPWHQDGGDVWALDRDPLVTLWIALDSARLENGCMEVIPGSHHLGLLSTRGSTVGALDVERHCVPERARALEIEAGHGVLVHNWLLHRSGVNPSPTPRRAFTACYMDGRTRSTLTGALFPMVAGTMDGAGEPYIRQIREDSERIATSFLDAERYAKSLESEVGRLRDARVHAEGYAKSLEADRDRFAHALAVERAAAAASRPEAARSSALPWRAARWAARRARALVTRVL